MSVFFQEEAMTTKKEEPQGMSAAAQWLGYRPEIRVLDCTVRDGGLMNDHMFDDKVIKAIYTACVEGGIDYMEMGYKASKKIFARDKFGAWKYCDEDDIRRIVGENDASLKLTVMADAERTDYHEDILPVDQSVLDVIRVATYVHQIPTAVDMIKDAHDKGYETTCNLMAVSAVHEWELDQALEALAKTEVEVVYLVDSFGALYLEQVQYLTKKYLGYMKAVGKEVGIHTHNNQQLAYANTIQAIIDGANRLDGSMAGLGRGAGNCQTELLLGFLHNPKFKLRPILECIQEHLEPMRKDLKWGFDLPYMITGQLNRHPRAAIAFNDQEGPKDIVAFYDSMVEEE
jgi:4-hydroxy 2-oxovalerate aldolase